jgi:Flagellar motor switch protein
VSDEDLLSQEEIDALLQGVDGGEVETERGVDEVTSSASSYDFNSQDRIVRGRMPTLEMVNERFARYFRISLFNFLRRSTEVSVSGIQMLKFSEYVQSLFVPTNLNIIKLKHYVVRRFCFRAQFSFCNCRCVFRWRRKVSEHSRRS